MRQNVRQKVTDGLEHSDLALYNCLLAAFALLLVCNCFTIVQDSWVQRVDCHPDSDQVLITTPIPTIATFGNTHKQRRYGREH